MSLGQQSGKLSGQFLGEHGKNEVSVLLLAGSGVLVKNGPGQRVIGGPQVQIVTAAAVEIF